LRAQFINQNKAFTAHYNYITYYLQGWIIELNDASSWSNPQCWSRYIESIFPTQINESINGIYASAAGTKKPKCAR
jgi:hypothetical protein